MAEIAAPFSTYATTVPEQWLDYNGHMHDASYAVALSDANETVFESVGLSVAYRESTGATLFTVECHIRFLAECSLGQKLSAASLVVAATPRTVRLYTELLQEDGRPAATGEFMYVHVDAARGATVGMSPEAFGRVRRMAESHARLPQPSHLGLGVGASRRDRESRDD